MNNPKCGFFKIPNDKQLPSCKKSDQNFEKNQSNETLYRDLNFVEDLNQLINYRNKIILKLLIDMDARGNKLSSCKISDQYKSVYNTKNQCELCGSFTSASLLSS